MPQPKILRAKDVAEELKISESTAYKLIKQLNKELSAKGYITFAGRVSSKYFYEKISKRKRYSNQNCATCTNYLSKYLL